MTGVPKKRNLFAAELSARLGARVQKSGYALWDTMADYRIRCRVTGVQLELNFVPELVLAEFSGFSAPLGESLRAAAEGRPTMLALRVVGLNNGLESPFSLGTPGWLVSAGLENPSSYQVESFDPGYIGRALALRLLFDRRIMKKKDPTDQKPAKKASAKKSSKTPVQPAGGNPAKPATKESDPGDGWDRTIYPRPDMTPAEIEERYGTWAPVGGEPSEEQSRAMVDELWLLLNDPEKLRKRNPIGHIMGIHEGRKPERVHLHFTGEAVAKVRSRQWHPTEDWRENPDGTLDYWLEIAPCWQVKNWVMGFMGKVTVVSPPGFRTIMRDTAVKLVKMYSKEPEE